jgi:hypothetical protein
LSSLAFQHPVATLCAPICPLELVSVLQPPSPIDVVLLLLLFIYFPLYFFFFYGFMSPSCT